MASHDPGPAPLRVKAIQSGTGANLTPVGELDLATAVPLSEAVLAAAAAGDGALTLDLSELRFIDVTGARTVLELAQEIGSRLTLLPGPSHVQRVFELTGVARQLNFAPPENVSQFPTLAERNLKYVSRIWSAFTEQGVDGLLQLVPPDVEWRPWGGRGQVLLGSDELRAFYGDLGAAGRGIPGEFRSLGDDVIVHTILPLPDGTTKTLFSLYEFDRGMLRRATSYEREADARAAAS